MDTERRDECRTDGTDASKKSKITFAVVKDTTPRHENVSPNLWDSLESDTESLVQEKAYQRELQQRAADESSDETPRGGNWREPSVEAGGSQGGVGEHFNRILDLEHTPPRCGPADKSTNSTRLSTLGDQYADLRYDPNWRRNLAETQFLSLDSLDFSDEPGYTKRHTEDVTEIERQEYVVVRKPALAKIDIIQPRPPSSSFHLHPQQSQFSHEDKDTKMLDMQSSSTSSESTPRLKFNSALKAKNRFIEYHITSPQHRQLKDSNKQNGREDQSSATAQEKSKDELDMVFAHRRHSQKVRQPRSREDIVERNKATLGLNTQKQGSYLKAYGQKGRKQDEINEALSCLKLPQTSVDTSIDGYGSPDNVQDPELIWIQKTQKLKIHKESKRSDGHKYQCHRARATVQLNPPTERHVSEAQSLSEDHIHTPSDYQSFSSTPNVNLNINLNSTGKLTEPYTQSPDILDPPPPPQWKIRTNLCSPPFIYPEYAVHQVRSAPLMPVSVLTPGHLHMESNHVKEDGRRFSGEPILREHERNKARITHEVVLIDEESVDSAQTLQTHGGGFAVLPPIGRSNETNIDLCNDRMEPLHALHRSSSEGYLAQLEKQRQLKFKTMYKAYTLKDYRSVNQKMNLGGLGPSNNVNENVAEKIRRQKLYSNVVREQNKKITMIPFLPARNPVASNNKNIIPRNKALEYAKTIAKPKASLQGKEKPREKIESECVFEHSACLQLGVDLSQLATLEMLRKRHEQEKQAVAHFINLHSDSSTPSVNTH